MSNLANIAGALIALAAVNKLLDRSALPGRTPAQVEPLIKKVAPITKPVVATRAEPITPFITVRQRADQAAFQRRQEAMTRKQLLSRYGL